MVEPKNIIIRMPNWIGDLVMATPLLTDLRLAFPNAQITAMALAPIGELLLEDPDIDELFLFKKHGVFRRHEERCSVIGKLRTGRYDAGILTTNSFSSAWLFWQGRVKRRIGYRGDWRSIFLTDSISREGIEKTHLVNAYKKLLEPLGIAPSTSAPRLHIANEEIAQAKVLLEKMKIPSDATLIGINPGAAYGSAKCWLPERFREVTLKLIEDPNVYVIYFGNGPITALIQEICRDLPSQVVNLAGYTTIREMLSVLKLCDCLLTNDSGPMHIASALGVPLVALFGSTDDFRTGPYNGGKVIHKRVSCSPCFLRECPIDFRCMKKITVEEVYQAILNEIKQSSLH